MLFEKFEVVYVKPVVLDITHEKYFMDYYNGLQSLLNSFEPLTFTQRKKIHEEMLTVLVQLNNIYATIVKPIQ